MQINYIGRASNTTSAGDTNSAKARAIDRYLYISYQKCGIKVYFTVGWGDINRRVSDGRGGSVVKKEKKGKKKKKGEKRGDKKGEKKGGEKRGAEAEMLVLVVLVVVVVIDVDMINGCGMYVQINKYLSE